MTYDSDDQSQTETEARIVALRSLISAGQLGTQDELRRALVGQSFRVNQSTISRDLRRIGAVRAVDAAGRSIYRLPDAATAPVRANSLRELVLTMQSNGSMVVVKTTPGSASLVARHIDQTNPGRVVLGTIAGDDTVFIALTKEARSNKALDAVRDCLG